MTQPPERDASGRFLKPEPEAAPIVPGEAGGMHPVSRLLFGWVESPRTPLVLLILVILRAKAPYRVKPGGIGKIQIFMAMHTKIHHD